MKFPQLVITSLLITVTVQISFPSATWSQVRPMVDPRIPSYVFQDSVADTLTISASDVMESLVKTWANELILRHPNLMVTAMTEQPNAGLATLLAHRTEIAALPHRITRTEIAEFILEYGYEPIEVPVAGNTLAIFVHKHDPSTSLSLAMDATARPVPLTSVKSDLSVEPPWHAAVYNSNPLRRNLYLYVAKPPTRPPTKALAELIRYILSQQGQQVVLDHGHSPLSLMEIRRVTSKWSTDCAVP